MHPVPVRESPRGQFRVDKKRVVTFSMGSRASSQD